MSYKLMHIIMVKRELQKEEDNGLSAVICKNVLMRFPLLCFKSEKKENTTY